MDHFDESSVCQKTGCNSESKYGAHGVRNGSVFSEYWCDKHYFEIQRGREPKPEELGAEE
jgi:hypothetical protein